MNKAIAISIGHVQEAIIDAIECRRDLELAQETMKQLGRELEKADSRLFAARNNLDALIKVDAMGEALEAGK